MGCASSTPMVATSGSEMLKAASHVATDAAKNAEDTVQDVTQTLGKTITNAKETVGTAVAGIAHDLSSAVVEQTETLEHTKNNMLERLHMGGGHNGEMGDKVASTSRVPSPSHDLDSLKTTTPEPEIEQALANVGHEGPPSPKATLSELEKLTAEVKQTTVTMATTTTTTIANAVTTAAAGAVGSGNGETVMSAGGHETTATTVNELAMDKSKNLAAEKRPGTTDWEKYADLLALHRKFNPYGSFQSGAARGGKFKRFGPPTHPRPVSKSNDLTQKNLHDYDSCQSDAYNNSSSQNSDSPRPVRWRLPLGSVVTSNAKRLHREFTSFVHQKRAQALSSQNSTPLLGRKFDFNPQRLRITSPSRSPTPQVFADNRINSPVIVNPDLLPRVIGPKGRILPLSHKTSPRPLRSRAVSRVVSPRPPSDSVSPKPTGKWGAPIESKTKVTRANTKVISPIRTTKLLQTKAFANARGPTTKKVNGFMPTRSHSSLETSGQSKWRARSPSSNGRLLQEGMKANGGVERKGRSNSKDELSSERGKGSIKPMLEQEKQSVRKSKKDALERDKNMKDLKPHKTATKHEAPQETTKTKESLSKESSIIANAANDQEKPKEESLKPKPSPKSKQGSTSFFTQLKNNFMTNENKELLKDSTSLTEALGMRTLETALTAANMLTSQDSTEIKEPEAKGAEEQKSEKLPQNDNENNVTDNQQTKIESTVNVEEQIDEGKSHISSATKSTKSSSSVILGGGLPSPDSASNSVISIQEDDFEDIIEDNMNDNLEDNVDDSLEYTLGFSNEKRLVYSYMDDEEINLKANRNTNQLVDDVMADNDDEEVRELNEDFKEVNESSFADNYVGDHSEENTAHDIDNLSDEELLNPAEFDIVEPSHNLTSSVDADLTLQDDEAIPSPVDMHAEEDYSDEMYHHNSHHSIDRRPFSIHTPQRDYHNMGRSVTMTSLRALPTPNNGTSSFRSSPRGSPFSIRKHYSSEGGDNHDSQKATFVADLSSVADKRAALTPSPYKVRARCAVCYKKYVIK